MADRYVYVQWTVELEEWRRNSVTGSNVPYSPRDPRQGSREPSPYMDEAAISSELNLLNWALSYFLTRQYGQFITVRTL